MIYSPCLDHAFYPWFSPHFYLRSYFFLLNFYILDSKTQCSFCIDLYVSRRTCWSPWKLGTLMFSHMSVFNIIISKKIISSHTWCPVWWWITDMQTILVIINVWALHSHGQIYVQQKQCTTLRRSIISLQHWVETLCCENQIKISQENLWVCYINQHVKV